MIGNSARPVGNSQKNLQRFPVRLRTKIVLPVWFRLERRARARLRAWPGRNDVIVSPRSTSLNEIGHLRSPRPIARVVD